MGERLYSADEVARQHLDKTYRGDARAFLWSCQRSGWTYEPVHREILRAQRAARFAWIAIVATMEGVGLTDDGGAVVVLGWDEVLAPSHPVE